MDVLRQLSNMAPRREVIGARVAVSNLPMLRIRSSRALSFSNWKKPKRKAILVLPLSNIPTSPEAEISRGPPNHPSATGAISSDQREGAVLNPYALARSRKRFAADPQREGIEIGGLAFSGVGATPSWPRIHVVGIPNMNWGIHLSPHKGKWCSSW